MDKEILHLIKIYKNKEKYLQCLDALVKANPPRIDDAINLQDKIKFEKDRQRAELLKHNDVFLKELSEIKSRLGENFFKILEEKIYGESPEQFFPAGETLITQSDFAEPEIIISSEDTEDCNYPHGRVYYKPGSDKNDPGHPDISFKIKNDPFFNTWPPLEVIIVDRFGEDYERLETLSFRRECKTKVFMQYGFRWAQFCAKWHIHVSWLGDLENLHVHSLPSLIIERDDKYFNLPIIIRVGAWTTREDVERAWGDVERMLKDIRVYRERENENFIRDSIWYKLNKQEGLSPSKIARFWAGKFPKEIDLEIIEKITKDEESFEGVELEQRLEETLSGDEQLEGLRTKFFEERAIYLKVGLADKVKKSIKKTAEKIRRLGSDEFDRNRLRLLREP